MQSDGPPTEFPDELFRPWPLGRSQPRADLRTYLRLPCEPPQPLPGGAMRHPGCVLAQAFGLLGKMLLGRLVPLKTTLLEHGHAPLFETGAQPAFSSPVDATGRTVIMRACAQNPRLTITMFIHFAGTSRKGTYGPLSRTATDSEASLRSPESLYCTEKHVCWARSIGRCAL